MWSELPRKFAPGQLGAKNRFWGPTLNFDPNMSLQRNMIWTTRKQHANLQGLPYMPPKFGELWSRNGWERLVSFCPAPNFSHWETLPALPHARYITDSRQDFSTCYVVERDCSLEQQNAGRADAGLCHACSLLCDNYHKTAKPIEMPFGELTYVGPGNH